MRPSPTAGQASLEYVAVISLIAAVLAIAAPAVGAPSLAAQAARTIRLGICIVAQDYCHYDDAQAAGLGPCALGRQVSGKDDSLSIAFFRLVKNDDWTVAANSDGSVTLTYSKGGGAGPVAGIGADEETPAEKLEVGAEASIGFRVLNAESWTFPDADGAKAFIAGLPDSRSSPGYPPAWQSGALSGELAAGAKASLGGLDAATLELAARGGASVRVGPDGALTLYEDLMLDAPELKLLGNQIVGLGRVRLMKEVTWVHGRPTRLALRQAIPSRRGNRMTEVVRWLDLRNPGNAFAARDFIPPALPPPGQVASRLSELLRFIAAEGTTERATYAYNDNSKSLGFTAKLGEEVGFSHTAIHISQTLLDASAKGPGEKPRERFDCVDQLR